MFSVGPSFKQRIADAADDALTWPEFGNADDIAPRWVTRSGAVSAGAVSGGNRGPFAGDRPAPRSSSERRSRHRDLQLLAQFLFSQALRLGHHAR
jgi:hypothetical protein